MAELRQIHEIVFASARRDASAPFLLLPDRTVSYGEAAAAVESMAATLVRIGVERGDRVAILATNSLEYVAAYYGSMCAGAIAVPINNSVDGPALRFVLSDCGATVLICQARFHAVVVVALTSPNEDTPEMPVRFVLSDDPATLVADLEIASGFERSRADKLTIGSLALALEGAVSFAPRFASVDERAPASIIYTSGSTGRPRGATLSHRNLLANTRSIVDYLHLSALDRMLVVLPFYYVYGKSLLNTHAFVGGSLLIGTDLYYPNEVVNRMTKGEATGLAGVPSSFSILMHRSKLPGSPPPSLRYVTQAGGAMAPDLTRRVVESLPGVSVYVMYGATEASARLTYLGPTDVVRKLGSIGKPIPGVTVRVLRPDGQEAGPHETGELVAQGDNIMLGYWNDPEESSRVLSPDGLRTGDLARRDEDGFLYIVGRSKEMIKSGAHRISPQEIEETLIEHPAVMEAAVIGVPDPLLGEAIRAYIVPRRVPDDALRLAAEITRFAAAKLPDYKVPTAVVVRDFLPKNEAGKIQKRTLREEIDRAGG